MKIYVASSWRNDYQQTVVKALRLRGHEVYDFRNPKPGDTGFAWSSIDPQWMDWTPQQYINGLKHALAVEGFNSDMQAMRWADAFVMVHRCGRSAHLEAGWACGAQKPTAILVRGEFEPELMASMAEHIMDSMLSIQVWADEVSERLKRLKPPLQYGADQSARIKDFMENLGGELRAIEEDCCGSPWDSAPEAVRLRGLQGDTRKVLDDMRTDELKGR